MTPSLTERSRQLVLDFYALAASGAGSLDQFLHDEVVIVEPPAVPYRGTYIGADAARKLFGLLARRFDLARLVVEDVVADGERVVARVSVPERDESEGNPVVRVLELWTLRDGRVVRLEPFYW